LTLQNQNVVFVFTLFVLFLTLFFLVVFILCFSFDYWELFAFGICFTCLLGLCFPNNLFIRRLNSGKQFKVLKGF